MWDENEWFCESKAATDKLWCSSCRKKITKGTPVVFKLDTSGSRERMKDVYCQKCGKEYHYETVSDTQHMHDLEG